jgi:hypothetical protein
MSEVSQDILNEIRKFNWIEIIEKGTKLEDLNDRQWRFIKGLVIELIVEKYSELKYVGEVSRDYYWKKFNLNVELKSGLSGSMYGKRGNVKKNFLIKLNNSNGTNKKDTLDSNDVADILIVVKNDGAFVVDKNTILRCSKRCGDGFDLLLNRSDLIQVSGRLYPKTLGQLNLKENIMSAIRGVI